MSADYGSATIAAVNSKGPSSDSLPVQPPIGWDKLDSNNVHMWNDHIGTKPIQSVTATDQNPAIPGGQYIAAQNTPGRDNLNAEMRWATCVAGCAQAATGTLTAGVFVVGAGTAVAKSAIPANGFGWVKV